MDKTCSREGCERLASSRGLCHSHYNCWHKKMKGKGLKLTRVRSLREVIEAAMPGTHKEIAERLDTSSHCVEPVIRKMRKMGEAHIIGYVPTEAGGHWQRVFAFGPGVDVELCAVYREVYMRRVKRDNGKRWYYRDKNRTRKASGASFAALLAPLGV